MLTLFTTLLLEIIAALCLICATAYIYLKHQYRYWQKQGVPGPEPRMVVGNMGAAYSLKCTEPEMLDKWYKEYRNEPYIGFYNLWKPTLLAIDPNLIKTIAELDFHHFTDRPTISGNSDSDAIMDSLFTMKGDRWKVRRQIFSKLFSPRKLKEYVEIMNRYDLHLFKDIDERIEMTGEIEIDRISERHMVRTMGAIMYGLDLSADEKRSSKLLELSEVFLHPKADTVIKFLFYTIAPNIFVSLGLKTFPNVLWDYFSRLTNELIYSRKEGKHDREDVVDLVNKLLKEGSHQTEKINIQESVGHIFSFFIAGHHTTLTTLTYILYELAQNPDIQKKLRNEVDNILKGQEYTSYESTKKMIYMDNVINETLRLYPLLGILKRNCNQSYKINDKITIPKGMDVVFPIQSLHRDPEYFPEPHVFNPERFSNSEKPPSAFMPFGKGPRTCIGKKLAYVSLKVTVAKIISEYLIFASPKTKHPIKYDAKTVIITARPLQGIWLKMKKRPRATLSF